MADLLLEIGTEEIPARFLPGALGELQALFIRECETQRLRAGQVATLGTPRRLALLALDVAPQQDPLHQEVVGPPRAVAFDPEGRPTRAAVGFARAQGVAVEALEVRQLDRGEFVVASRTEPGRPTAALLPEMLPRLILALPFPKAMRWGTGDLRFVRPIHWVVALYGEEVIAFALDGVQSGRASQGHRFMAPGPVEIARPGVYEACLEQARVYADPARRRTLIAAALAQETAGVGGLLLEDDPLLEEVTFMVEYPSVVRGTFEAEFLSLPREVLITALREHQRYFAVTDAKGALLPYFLAVNNTLARDPAVVRAGHERVLRARLADARFFFEEDRRAPLHARVDALKGVLFQAKLGSYHDKVLRVQRLAEQLAEAVAPAARAAVSRAALLCKADLTTSMVGEFPNLQGIMGREYARRSGEPEPVALAIGEHYRPAFSGDRLPESEAGALLSVADKLDTIAGCFGVGLIPTGTSDPWALRRQALGVLAIILERRLVLSLPAALEAALAGLHGRLDRPADIVREEVLTFFRVRLENLLEGEGHPGDIIRAVLAAGADPVVEAVARVRALASFRARPEFTPLATTVKRVTNILRGAGALTLRDPDPNLLREPAEHDLLQACATVKIQVDGLVAAGEFTGALEVLAGLQATVDRFFTQVLVMADDPHIRATRLALLGKVAELFSRIADFAQIAG